MLYRLFKPSPELADMISCYWYTSIKPNHYSEQQYATPLVENIVFNFTNLKEYHRYEGRTRLLTKNAYLFGQTRSRTVISGRHEDGGYIIGVNFKPLGLARLTGISMVHLAGKVVDAEDIWGRELGWLCEAMQEAPSIEVSVMVLDNFLKEQGRTVCLHHRIENVHYAISLMLARKGNISGKELCSLTNTSEKTLARSFMNFKGMKPKLYNQIIRFNAARQLLGQGAIRNMAALAYDLGYFDQPHFIKDFKRFSGQTPTTFLKAIEAERRKRTIPID